MESEPLHTTPTNSASDSEGALWGIAGNLVWTVLGGAILSMASWVTLWQTTYWDATTTSLVAAVPAALALGYALFKQTHPPGYDVDLVDGWLRGEAINPARPCFEETEDPGTDAHQAQAPQSQPH